jgi:hypothetical protein
VVGTGINALADHLTDPPSTGFGVDMFVPSYLVAAITQAGAAVRAHRHGDGSSFFECAIDGKVFYANERGGLTFYCPRHTDILEWMRKALDRVLPPSLAISRSVGDSYESREAALTAHASKQADRIIAATLPLIDGGRCILLDGRPGVGKTTIAQIVARDSMLGRVVVLDGNVAGNQRIDGGLSVGKITNGDVKDALGLLSPGVIVVDDVDKISLSLSQLEALRASARLVVLTANNGQYDEVLDGALMRAGRVDEVFSIEPENNLRKAPFDALSDDDWGEVSQWPIAYLNEVEKRLRARAGDIRLDDLRQRLSRRTRSSEVLR